MSADQQPLEYDDRELSELLRKQGVEIDAGETRKLLEVAKFLGIVAADAVYRSREAAIRLAKLRNTTK